MTSDALAVVLAAVAGVGVGFFVQAARGKGTWRWRAAGAIAGLAGVGVLTLHALRDGGTTTALVVFTVLIAGSYAFAPRERRPRAGSP